MKIVPAGYRVIMSTSTVPDEQSFARPHVGMWSRRVLVVLLLLLVVAAVSGVLGGHTSTASAAGGGYQVQVRYAATARGGLQVPFEVELRRQQGFSGPVQLAVSSAYLQALQLGTTLPEPSQSTADGDRVVMTFDPPRGTTLQVSWQAQLDPSTRAGRQHGQVAVLENGTAVATARFSTWVWP